MEMPNNHNIACVRQVAVVFHEYYVSRDNFRTLTDTGEIIWMSQYQ